MLKQRKLSYNEIERNYERELFLSKRVFWEYFEIPTVAVFHADLFSIDFRISNERSVLFLQKMCLQTPHTHTHTHTHLYTISFGDATLN